MFLQGKRQGQKVFPIMSRDIEGCIKHIKGKLVTKERIGLIMVQKGTWSRR